MMGFGGLITRIIRESRLLQMQGAVSRPGGMAPPPRMRCNKILPDQLLAFISKYCIEHQKIQYSPHLYLHLDSYNERGIFV
jgi:hypothetical protein